MALFVVVMRQVLTDSLNLKCLIKTTIKESMFENAEQ